MWSLLSVVAEEERRDLRRYLHRALEVWSKQGKLTQPLVMRRSAGFFVGGGGGGGGGICPLFDNTCTSVIFLLVAHSTCTCICWKLLEKDMYEKTCYEIHVYVCIYI